MRRASKAEPQAPRFAKIEGIVVQIQLPLALTAPLCYCVASDVFDLIQHIVNKRLQSRPRCDMLSSGKPIFPSGQCECRLPDCGRRAA